MPNHLEPAGDPASDLLRSERETLRAFFSPQNVALIGATEKAGSVGRTVLWNLISNPFGGAVFPINPKRKQVLGIRAYADIASVPEPVCFIDYDRAIALVVDRNDPKTGEHEIVAIGRLTKTFNSKAEFAIIVADQHQRQGLGEELLSRLVQFGRDDKLHKIQADILTENRGMQRVSEKLGFTLRLQKDPTLIRAELILQ